MEIRTIVSDEHTTFVNAIDLSIHDSIGSLKSIWLELENNSPISVYQRYGWVKDFIDTYKGSENIKPYIVVGRLNDDVVFLLPFSIEGKYIKRIQFVGGNHANFNLGIFSPKYENMLDAETINGIFKRICNLNPGIGYLKLSSQPQIWRNKPNPLLQLPKQLASNPAFILDLEGGFDATLARGNAKRKRKKFRQQTRISENAGGYEFIVANTKKEIVLLLETFLEQKKSQLKHLGIRNSFNDPSTYIFLEKLAFKSLKLDEPLLRLYGLKVGDEIVATFGAGVLDKKLSGYFSSITRDKYSTLSPGEMLLYLIVEDACERGYEQMDLGIGEERYKTSWSSEKRDMYDVIVPISTISIPVVFVRRKMALMRRQIRNNPRLWQSFKNLRSLKGKYLPV